MGPLEYILRRPWTAGAEILILFLFFYGLLRVMGGTRVSGIVRGGVVGFILLYVGVQYIANALALERVQGLLSALVGALGISAIVVFAPDLRRALARLSQSPLFFPVLKPQQSRVVDHVVNATLRLARQRIGALVVFERQISLKGFSDTGTPIDAEVTDVLLENIFFPGSPLHDGAVLIRGSRIAAARVILPHTESPALGPEFGMRHRAGVGISEESDAIAIIVSEERGTVCVAAEGRLIRDLDRDRLRDLLRELCAREERPEGGAAGRLARLARMVTTRRGAPSPEPPRESGEAAGRPAPEKEAGA
jgi:diadenylate cyclase